MKRSVAAHLIVGAREEPFLEALLASLEGAVDMLIVNDNAPDPSPHAGVMSASTFGRRDAIIVDRSPFVDFATARNTCLALHRVHAAGEWAAFVDADEVHNPAVQTIAGNLRNVPDDTDFVDGYTWHFFATPRRYTSIERRMAFFRVRETARWEGSVHEHLLGMSGKRIALPYVYAHYGHILDVRRHAEKGRQYSALGQAGDVVAADRLNDIDMADYFAFAWPRLLRFRGNHPPAARATLERLGAELASQFALAEHLTRERQSFADRQRNALEALNYEFRWRARALNPPARALTRGQTIG